MKRALLIPLVMVCLQAEAPVDRFTWKPLLVSPDAGVDLRYSTVTTEIGLALQFRNFGHRTIHFDFYLPGLQTPDQSITQGRVHVTHGRKSGPLVIPGLTTTSTPSLLRVRLGDDTGSYWRD